STSSRCEPKGRRYCPCAPFWCFGQLVRLRAFPARTRTMLLMLYLIAITAEAMTGALSAGRRGMDWFGVVLIACVTALGGGSVRDVLLGHYPLTWVKHPEYLVLTSCAALLTIFIAPLMRHL